MFAHHRILATEQSSLLCNVQCIICIRERVESVDNGDLNVVQSVELTVAAFMAMFGPGTTPSGAGSPNGNH
jgi:hypothetical protein